MEVIDSFPHTDYPPTVVTVGNFDGCHRGHHLLLDKVVRLAEEQQQRSVVISFRSRCLS